MRNHVRWIVMLTVSFALVTSTLFRVSDAKRSDHKTQANERPPSQKAALTKSHFLPAVPSSVQESDSLTPIVSRAVAFAVSEPVSEMEEKTELSNSMRRGKAEANQERPEKNTSPPLSGHEDFDATVPSQAPSISPAIPSPASNFEALNNNDNATHPAILGFVNPPDTVGDVGPTQYVQAVNLLFRVYDKSGVPQTAPQPISALFAALGPPCSNNDDGDPIVLYDSLADRWIITQFMVSGATPLSQCVAISQTGNAAGAYFTYRFVMPNAKFNDYPKFGVWPDGYYWSNNQFNLAGTAFLGVGVFAMDRGKLLAGDPTASYIFFDLETTVPNARSMLPSDADGLTPPPAGAPNVFSYFNANEFVGETDSLRLYEFNADFANPMSSTFTQRPESPVAVAAFSPLNPAGLDDIEQPPPSTATSALDSISDRLMNSLQYRNFGAYESLITNHTVNVGTGNTLATHQAGVRYYELRRTLPAGSWTVNEQATHSPDTNNRWMGSAAMDHEGNLAVGYSVSSTTVFPSIRYAGRFAGDAPGGLFQGEASIQVGAGVQTNTGSRWGDYSSMNVDPTDDCTFWYTTEYYATTDTTPGNAPFGVNWQTRVASFKVNPTCAAPQQGTLQVNVTNCATGLPVPGALVNINGNLYGATGAGGSNSSQLSPGTYNVTASATNYLSGSASATITNGNTTVVNVCVTPVPIIQTAGSTITAESCEAPDGGISPGETVTIDFGLKNVGTAPTSNLVATLLATGGVTSPSGPQSYGVLSPVGPSVSRPFTFTADSSLACGDSITATFALQDGASNLGTVTFTYRLGVLGFGSTTATYSSGNLTTPIADLSTVDIPINITDTGAVADVNVKVRLNHTFDGDVELSLVAPDGTTVMLSDNRGGTGDNFGTGANDCSGTPTVFDDSASTSIVSGSAPFSGSFKPEQPLAGLNGKDITGTWKLRVTDTANLDTGTVFCVQLEISRHEYLCCPFSGGAPGIIPKPPATLVSECGTNGKPDPGEVVTMSFPLVNNGTAPTTDLVATLQASGGVTPLSGPQSYGVLSPIGGVAVARDFTFAVSSAIACGGTFVATFDLTDGPMFLGTASFTITAGGTVTNVSTFSNTGAITIPGTGTGATTGAPANPYPSNISVSGIVGTVTKVVVKLNGLNHTFPSDADMLLVGPAGQKFTILSDIIGGTDAVNINYTLDDSAAGLVPSTGTPVSGTFRPTNYGTGDLFPAPAPAAPYQFPATAGSATFASVFNGQNPNGTWSLYVVDDAGLDTGSLTGGWTLEITTEDPVCETIPVVDITGVSVDKPSLWPPNHRMEEVTVNYSVASCSFCTLSVTSNEPVNGTGEGDTAPDWEIIDSHKLRLRAERAGTGTGRVYTIGITCQNGVNTDVETVVVKVPFSQKK